MKRTAQKAIRDLLVLLVATAAWYVGTNVAELGLPEEIAPLVATIALAVYRLGRAQVGMAPPSDETN